MSGQQVFLGPAPVAPAETLQAQSGTVHTATTNNWYDTSNRAAIANSWNQVMAPTNGFPTGWNGNVDTNTPGDTTSAFKNAVATRLNWIRAMAGVPVGVTIDLTHSAMDQKAALMFSANRQLSHTPPNTWMDWTQDGYTAAGNSNICVGIPTIDPGCVVQYMVDNGSNNTVAGHRRWIIYPQTQNYGTGDVPESYPSGNPSNPPYYAANALWVFDGNYGTTRPATRDFQIAGGNGGEAWPPPGYVPYQVVPPRWSFSYPNADFSSSSVTMTRNGSPVSVQLEPVANGYGENSIVWITDNQDPNGLFNPTPPPSDTTSTVHVTNVLINGIPREFDYNVTVFDPSTSPPSEQLVPIAPCRVLDTRGPTGPFGGPFMAGGSTRIITIPSSGCGIPNSAMAYSLNVTVVPRVGTLGYLSIWPVGQAQPTVSTLNSPDGSILSNAAIVPAGTGGAINLYVTHDTDVVIDINAYFTAPASGTLQFYTLAPCRVLDTRSVNGTFGGPAIPANGSRTFPIVSSSCSVPASAQAFSFNVTVVPHGGLGYLTTWPTGQSQPTVSTLNSLDGSVRAVAAIVAAGAGGLISFFATNTTDLVVDINGYFAPPGSGGLNFYALAPCRVADTRGAAAPLGGPLLSGGATRDFPVASACGLPSTAAAYSFNMTAVPQGFLGYLTTWPVGLAQPTVSTLNGPKGIVVANAAIVPAGTGGDINAFVTQAAHLVIDTNGYFQ